MTLIKSHSCTKCGGVLIVHNDKQQYECPYCGIFYDYEYFRLRDILEQAAASQKVLQYDSAREKYSFLYSFLSSISRTPRLYDRTREVPFLPAPVINSVSSASCCLCRGFRSPRTAEKARSSALSIVIITKNRPPVKNLKKRRSSSSNTLLQYPSAIPFCQYPSANILLPISLLSPMSPEYLYAAGSLRSF